MARVIRPYIGDALLLIATITMRFEPSNYSIEFLTGIKKGR